MSVEKKGPAEGAVVSEGTLVLSDLIRNLSRYLGRYSLDSTFLLRECRVWLLGGVSYALEYKEANHESAGIELLEELFRELELIAPEGTFFGYHPGDGALIGFWNV